MKTANAHRPAAVIMTITEQLRKEGMDQGLKTRLQQGIEKERLAAARKMLQKGMDADLIQEITELPLEKIKELKKEMGR